MRIIQQDTLRLTGIDIASVVAYYQDGSYLIHDEHEFYVIDRNGIRQRFGRRRNHLNRELEDVVADIERMGEVNDVFGIDEKKASINEYFEHHDPFERIEHAKITEDGRLVVIYQGHRIPSKIRFYTLKLIPL